MEYAELVEAINEHDRTKTNRLIEEINPRLIRFLQIHMNAPQQDAEDCVQLALLKSVEAIREGKVRDAEQILSFLLTACRNNYLNLLKQKKERLYRNIDENYTQQPRQLLTIINDERRQILEWCLQQLSEDYKTFIDYWFSHPDSGSRAASTHFGISVSNVWTRKHRVLKKLSDCCRKKNDI